MKSTSHATAPRNNNTGHPPLARNAQGHPIPMPDGAVSWLIKRETRGRPQVIKGPDGHPYRLPLAATDQDVLATFGAGTYRLEALDALGNVIEYVTTVRIADDEPADEDGGGDDDDDHEIDVARESPALRYALQTIDRVTRAQSDAIRAVTEAQADWVKSLAVTRSLPRNAMFLPAPSSPQDRDDDGDDGDDGQGEPSAPNGTPPIAPESPNWMTSLGQSFGVAMAPAIERFVANMMARFVPPAQTPPSSPGDTPPPGDSTPPPPADPARPAAPPNPMVHLAQIHEGLTQDERDFLSAVLRSPRGDQLAAELLARSVDEAIDLISDTVAQMRVERARARAAERARAEAERAKARPPQPPHDETAPTVSPASDQVTTAGRADFMSRVLAVATRLDADQRAAVLALLPRLAPEQIEELKAQLLAMTAEDAAVWIRENSPRLRAGVEA
jgi:hypothetical protein